MTNIGLFINLSIKILPYNNRVFERVGLTDVNPK
jgi:hypothetical protein